MGRLLEDLRASNEISPILEEAVKKRNLEITEPDPLVRRQQRANHLSKLRQFMPLAGQPISEVQERDIYVSARDGYQIRVRVYTPNEGRRVEGEGDGGGRPLVLMFHEGGFMAGDLTDEEMNCRLFCRDLGVVCGNIEYR